MRMRGDDVRRVPQPSHTAAVVILLWLAVSSGAWRASTAAPAAPAGAPPDSTAVRASEPDHTPPPLRLPRTLLPQSNRATLVLDPTQETFVGHLTMEARVATPVQVFWLHADHLTIDAATISAGGERWALAVLPQATDVVGFRSAREIPAGPVTLDVTYRGRIHDTETKGLFRQHEGVDWYVFTQFEALGARRAYPCFDEPDSKVPWQITLEVPHSLVAVSNTPVASDTLTDHGTRVVTFRETPPLPSYLVAFAVGPFAAVDAGTTRTGTPLRVIVPKGRSGDVGYVVEHTAPLLTWIEDYFGMPYPYAKLDLLAIPLTVGFGAMEHPGLITVNQRLVVARREDFTLGFQRAFAAVTAHELAHQWFGDLVTLAWWDDLWLNEAFASWLGDKVVQAWRPAWDAGVRPVTQRAGALDADALQTARRLRQPIQSTHDIENAFDRITYAKGAAVLTMFEHWLGAGTFRDGIRAYLRQHAWQNTTAADFLAALSAVAGRDVATPFTTFLEQVGAPLITFALACPQDQPPQLRLTQARYLPQGSHADPQGTWQVPVCVTYPAGDSLDRDCTLLSVQTAAMALTGARSCPAWIMPNTGGLGYYRVQLDGDLLVQLLDRGMPRLSLPERVSVIDDVHALVRAGTVDVALALGLVERYARDDSRHMTVSATWSPMSCDPTSRGSSVRCSGRGRASWAGRRPRMRTTTRASCGPVCSGSSPTRATTSHSPAQGTRWRSPG